MAIKIETDSIVRIVRPSSKQFNIDELNNHVNGFIEPVKFGPIWLMYDEKAKLSGEPINNVASFFFDVAIHGTVMLVPPQELPSDWGLMDSDDYLYTANDVDNGLLLSIQNALIHNRVFGAPGPGEMADRLRERFKPVEEWTYKPSESDEINDNTAEFFEEVYQNLLKKPEDIVNNVIISNDLTLVKLESGSDKETMINKMIDYYISKEEYEKCSVLKTLL